MNKEDYRAMYLKVRDELAELQQRNMTKEALTQLREVHAIQGRDGCWDIDDYMLGLYNGLELALSIVENRECRYKQRPKSQPEQEPVCDKDPQGCWNVRCQLGNKCRNTSLQPKEPEQEPDEGVAMADYMAIVEKYAFLKASQRTWVGLTRMDLIKCGVLPFGMSYELCQAIEAKLKQKNGYAEEKNI